MKLLRFNVSHGIGVMSSATVDVVEEAGDSIVIGDKITLTVTREEPPAAAIVDTVFVGRIGGFTPNHRISDAGDVTQIRCIAIPSGLSRCPVVTEFITVNPIATVLGVGGLSASFFSVATEPSVAIGKGIVVNENSCLAAVQRIAQLNQQVWFVRPDGAIRFSTYGSEVDTSPFLAANIAGNVSDVQEDLDQVSMVKVRGKFDEATDSDIVILIDAFTGTATIDADNNSIAIITVDITAAPHSNPSFTEEQLEKIIVITRESRPTDTGDSTIEGEIIEYDQPNLKIQFITSKQGSFGLGSTVDIYFTVVASVTPESEIENVDQRGFGTGQNMVMAKDGITQMFRLNSGTYAIYDKQANRLVNEPSENRPETTLEIGGLVTLIGVKYQEIDNPYATSAQTSNIATLVKTTTERSARKLTFSGPYFGLVNVNSTWTIPLIVQGREKTSPPPLTVVGILDKWSIAYDASNGDAVSHYTFFAGTVS